MKKYIRGSYIESVVFLQKLATKEDEEIIVIVSTDKAELLNRLHILYLKKPLEGKSSILAKSSQLLYPVIRNQEKLTLETDRVNVIIYSNQSSTLKLQIIESLLYSNKHQQIKTEAYLDLPFHLYK